MILSRKLGEENHYIWETGFKSVIRKNSTQYDPGVKAQNTLFEDKNSWSKYVIKLSINQLDFETTHHSYGQLEGENLALGF